ncbi:MAG: sulfurtransferase [Alphaproteobacteria bacterium]|nr:sulfurtransferase [Alphaproteobacteria bacterium]
MRLSTPAFAWLAGLVVALTGSASASELSPLVDVDWIKANADRDDVVLLDIRNKIDGGSAETFAKGHIPGAVHSDYLMAGWRTKVDGVIGQVPKAETLEALIGGLGIDNESTVVVIPAGVSSTDFGSAARVYWTFNYVGHDQVAILDGGYRAWTADPNNPIETGPGAPEATIFEATLRPELRVDSKAVEAALGAQGKLLVDARPTKQFTGLEKHDAAKAAGHIPGAAHFDQAKTFDEKTGKLVDLAKLESLLPAGLEEADEVLSYCNTGHWAAVNWFVLSEVAGKANVKLYDGSMVEWTQDPARPLEK